MRMLTSLFVHGKHSLAWLLFPICLFIAAQAFSRPFSGIHDAGHAPTVTTAPQAVTVTAGSNGPLCAGATLNLTSTVTAGTMPFIFAWSGPAGFTSNAQNPSRPNTLLAHAGTYTVTVTDGTGMSGTASVNVQIDTPATADAGPDKALCTGSQHPLNGIIGGSATSATWSASVGGGTFLPSPQVLNATYSPPAGYMGAIIMTLTTNDPAGPCPAASDQMVLNYATPGALVCNDTVYISIGQSCSVVVTPDMALEEDVFDDLYTVTLFTPQGQNIGNTITSQYVGVVLTIRIQDNCSGNFCITKALVEDYLPRVCIPARTSSCPAWSTTIHRLT
ncbi:MAG: hypothetical protein IPM98_15895 [Lewinellaceae bacterium]|nr:hypothetical protein [Lewinellaceae bacterium]